MVNRLDGDVTFSHNVAYETFWGGLSLTLSEPRADSDVRAFPVQSAARSGRALFKSTAVFTLLPEGRAAHFNLCASSMLLNFFSVTPPFKNSSEAIAGRNALLIHMVSMMHVRRHQC